MCLNQEFNKILDCFENLEELIVYYRKYYDSTYVNQLFLKPKPKLKYLLIAGTGFSNIWFEKNH